MLETILVVPDCHIPYHDKRAWALMLKVGAALKPHHIVVLGDFLDMYSVSAHSKDPNRALKLDSEVETSRACLDQLDALKAKHKIFIAGNHEDRLERYLQDKAPELFNLVKCEKLLDLKERGWRYVPYRSDCSIGKMNYTHDVGASGRAAAFRALDTYQHNITTGHTHRIISIVEGNAAGKSHVSSQFGWLGSKEAADYMHRVKAARDWSLGFGIQYLNLKNGFVYVVPVPIVEYTCVVNGVLFKG